jgi:osmotically-inducible protein OsmY
MSLINKRFKKSRKVDKEMMIIDRPNLVIIGDEKILDDMKSLSDRFNVIFKMSAPKDLSKVINTKTIGVLVDEKQVKYRLKYFLNKLLRDYKLLPLFLISRSKKRTSFYNSLYDKGLQAVINWPQEKEIFTDILIESLKPQPRSEGMSKADAKLADLIKVHIGLHGNFNNINVKVIEGFAFISGIVKSLAEKDIIEKEASKVLGIKKAIVKNLKVRKTKKITDDEIERKLKMYAGNILGQEKKAISVKVNDKKVAILGAARCGEKIHHIEKFAKRQPGVLEVNRFVKIAPNTVKRNVKKAKVVEKKLKSLFNGVKFISVNIYGDFAEVSGTVKVKEHKNLVERYLMHMLPIRKVFNKLYVTA